MIKTKSKILSKTNDKKMTKTRTKRIKHRTRANTLSYHIRLGLVKNDLILN